jgi:acetoacetate decarboxylase
MFIAALHEGTLIRYSPQMLVTNDMAMNYGREVLGLPKKKAHIVLENRPEGVLGYAERPRGHRLLTLGIALERSVDLSTLPVTPPVPAVALRLIGEPVGSDPEVRVELIETTSTWQLKEQWTGTGTINFPNSTGGIDDWGMLPVKKILAAGFGRCDIQIPYPRLLATL